MKSWRERGGRREPLVAAVVMTLVAAMPAAAQVANDTATQTPTPAALPVPRPPVIIIPAATATPTPAALRPRATATPRPKAMPTRAAVSLAPEPSASATPAAATPPVAIPPGALAPAPSSTPAPVPATISATGQGASFPDYWPLVAGVAAVALLAFGWMVLRRRRAPEEGDAQEVDGFSQSAPLARARLALGFRPIRAGLNLLSATSENEITVTNIGDAPAADIRLGVRLFSAHAGQDAELDEFYAAPIRRPAVPGFALQPGEQRVVTTIAALPRDAVRTLTVAGRPMFVPLVAVNLVYDTADGEGQFAQAFPVGVERVDSSKLAPFWLDVPPRTYDQVAARPHAPALER